MAYRVRSWTLQKVMRKDVKDLSELYMYALTRALQVNCMVKDEVFQELHRAILDVLVRAGKQYGFDTSNLKQDATRILTKMKSKISKRKFIFNTCAEKMDGRYTFPIVEPHEIIDGVDNTQLLHDITESLFATDAQKSDMKTYPANNDIDTVKAKLGYSRLLPMVLQRHPKTFEVHFTDNGKTKKRGCSKLQ